MLRVLLAKIFLNLAQVGTCPEGFEDWDSNSEFCYMIKSGGVSWTEAFEHCSSLGGNLPSVNSPEEQETLKLKAIEHEFNPWIGLRVESKCIYYL